jgi:Transcription factor WhiB
MTGPDGVRRAAALALTIPAGWAKRALCAQADPDAWFPEKGQSAAIAIRVCGHCRSARSAWTTRCPEQTPGAGSLLASGVAPRRASASCSGSSGGRRRHDERYQTTE